jgi:hypothetical protein
MPRPVELIVSFRYATGAGWTGEGERCVTLTIGRSEEDERPTFAFRPEQARVLGRELLATADRADAQDPTQS